MSESTSTEQPVNPNRKVMVRYLDEHLGDETRQDVEEADFWIDDALDAVDEEEPRLLDWLENDEDLGNVFWANRAMIYWLIMRDIRRERPIERTVAKIDKLMGRIVAAVAFRSVMRERKGIRDWLA